MTEEAIVGMQELGSLLGGVARTVRDVVVRDMTENPAEYAKVVSTEVLDDDPALAALRVVIDGIQSGKSIQNSASEIARLVNNQESRADLIDTLILTHEYDRLMKFLTARKRVEDVMLTAASSGRMSPTEAMAFMAMMSPEIKAMMARVKSSTAAGKDVFSLLSKVDFVLQQDEAALAEKFKHTTPQARELARRITHKLQKATSS